MMGLAKTIRCFRGHECLARADHVSNKRKHGATRYGKRGHEPSKRGRALSFSGQRLPRRPVDIACCLMLTACEHLPHQRTPFLRSVFNWIIILLAGGWNEISCFPAVFLKRRPPATSAFPFVGLTLVRGDLFSPV